MPFDHRRYPSPLTISRPNRQWPDRRIQRAPDWCSVDLRDGNQALIDPMSVEQKRVLFDLLVRIGVKEIEIGFPAASQPDYDFCRWLVESGRIPDDVTVQVLVQARADLIERTFAALEGVPRAIVHVYNSTSRVQREQVFGLSREGIVEIATAGARMLQDCAANYPQTQWTFQYSPESFTGTEPDFAVEIIDAVTAVWRPDQGQAVVINLPATVETTTPNVFADLIEDICEKIRWRSHLRISVHTHNDRGGAVAAAELALLAGADRVEGTLLGNGERTGNMDLVVMAMNLYSQGVDPALDLGNMAEIVRVVESCTGIAIHPRHPWAGSLVFTAFSGSHQDAIRKCMHARKEGEPWEVAYLPVDPADLNRSYEEVVRINSQSGKGGVAWVLEQQRGITLPKWAQIAMGRVVQQHAESVARVLEPAEIVALYDDLFHAGHAAGWTIRRYGVQQEGGMVSVSLELEDGMQLQGTGHGLLEAAVEGLARAGRATIVIEQYEESAQESGTDAQATAWLGGRAGTLPVFGASTASDTAGAALQALLNASAAATMLLPVRRLA